MPDQELAGHRRQAPLHFVHPRRRVQEGRQARGQGAGGGTVGPWVEHCPAHVRDGVRAGGRLEEEGQHQVVQVEVRRGPELRN